METGEARLCTHRCMLLSLLAQLGHVQPILPASVIGSQQSCLGRPSMRRLHRAGEQANRRAGGQASNPAASQKTGWGGDRIMLLQDHVAKHCRHGGILACSAAGMHPGICLRPDKGARTSDSTRMSGVSPARSWRCRAAWLIIPIALSHRPPASPPDPPRARAPRRGRVYVSTGAAPEGSMAAWTSTIRDLGIS